jgi:hypothetical protein
MLKYLYKKILRELRLSQGQLSILKNKLNTDTICAGPFIDGYKMCPNTTALSIKLNRNLNKGDVKSLLKTNGVSDLQLKLFYIIFDTPAMISKSYFQKSLQTMQQAISELEQLS